ncbi:MAG TPA: hydrogenase maturation protease, partial [Bacteroidota bacterium]|nr:hydrogenase maturation protease [Bacteroidota bacterium]
MKRALVIGIGNTLRSDDGAGVWAAARIAVCTPEAKVISVQELTPDLCEYFEAVDLVLLLDASTRVSRVQVTPLGGRPEAGLADTHRLTPEGILHLAHLLYGWAGEAML